jgi:hypothetical protein
VTIYFLSRPNKSIAPIKITAPITTYMNVLDEVSDPLTAVGGRAVDKLVGREALTAAVAIFAESPKKPRTFCHVEGDVDGDATDEPDVFPEDDPPHTGAGVRSVKNGSAGGV